LAFNYNDHPNKEALGRNDEISEMHACLDHGHDGDGGGGTKKWSGVLIEANPQRFQELNVETS
jgi:hypothetical protein